MSEFGRGYNMGIEDGHRCERRHAQLDQLEKDVQQLREQNRVLASHLRTLCSSGNKLLDDLIGTSDSADSLKYHIKRAQAALTATSQEGQHESR